MKTVLTAIAAATILASAASANEVCMSKAEMQSSLIDWYGERPATDLSADNTRLWVSDKTGSWTMVRNLSDGNACVVAQGTNWSSEMNAATVLDAVQDRIES